MCILLGVSRSGFYKSIQSAPSARKTRHAAITREVIHFHERSGSVYGYRKVAADLRMEGKNRCCAETVRRIMAERGLHAKAKRKFVVTTQSRHSLPVFDNVLDRNFAAFSIDQKWTADITYIRTMEGWLYLAGVMDLFSRRIIGWSMSDRIDADLACDALNMAIAQRKPEPGLIHHSDRGVQYASQAYQAILKRCGIICSMSRKGNCWDNASQESFFGKLKAEWIRGTIYKTRKEARQSIFNYIELFHNRQRRHAALGYVSPVEFEKRGDRTTAA